MVRETVERLNAGINECIKHKFFHTHRSSRNNNRNKQNKKEKKKKKKKSKHVPTYRNLAGFTQNLLTGEGS